MPVSDAQRSFNKGLAALNKGLAALAAAQPLRAVDCFLDAMQIEERLRVRQPDMRFLSYYGLSLARANRATNAAAEACELAAHHDPRDPLMLLNLGRVRLLAGRRAEALECFKHGLRLVPGHAVLLQALERGERRSVPVLPCLDRSNKLNRWVGRVRDSFRTRIAAAHRTRMAHSP